MAILLNVAINDAMSITHIFDLIMQLGALKIGSQSELVIKLSNAYGLWIILQLHEERMFFVSPKWRIFVSHSRWM